MAAAVQQSQQKKKPQNKNRRTTTHWNKLQPHLVAVFCNSNASALVAFIMTEQCKLGIKRAHTTAGTLSLGTAIISG